MELAERISTYNRQRKWRFFEDVVRPGPETLVLDVGFSEQEWQASDNFIEKHYPFPHNLTALGIDEPKLFLERYPDVTTETYDGRSFPFADKSFDVCWSNAVIEHVGGRDEQLFFVRECKRVARKVFLTTPNRHFPIEPHTRTPLLHWLPRPLFESYLKRIGKGWATGDYMHLLSAGDLRRLMSAAGVDSYTMKRNRLMGLTLDFVVVFDG